MSPKEVSNGMMEEENTASAVSEQTEMQVDGDEARAAAGQDDGSAQADSKLQANERLLFCAEVLIGYKCEVQVRTLRAGYIGQPDCFDWLEQPPCCSCLH